MEKVATLDARPPRQWDDTIPRELERICLKLLSKRAAERYTTAKDVADDIRCWLVEAAKGAGVPALAGAERMLPAEAVTPAQGDFNASSPPFSASSGREIIRVIPKGLRSFDEHDADFFLELLAGPRDRTGMPDSIRFWKTRIEHSGAHEAFPVGLIYGPSGCGKSSLVKAGLLPRLASSVAAVYVEASAGETEARLLRSLRRRIPGLPENNDLAETLAALRVGNGLAPGDKLLVVIDQFEQWLHTHGGEKDAELTRALRQCDGHRVQCIVMVRDDFWLAVSRFMQELEIRLVEGENSRLVDLFDARHARKVLAAMGHAYGALPETNRGSEQDQFLDQAVAGLAQEGKVVPVRLSLFAEMVKSKPWTPRALREIGGAEGVGVAFLEEMFASPSAPPRHRLYQKTAQAVLAALLPEAGTDIKGHLRSRDELLAASGCTAAPARFDDVMTLLDRELRLVTPSDSESLEAEDGGLPAGERGASYQLTHDYLVPSLRTWLTGKQKATRRGRAELRLADIAALWAARRERRRLPSLVEFVQIRLLTSSRKWNETQRRVMAAASRHYALGSAIALAFLAIIAVGWREYRGSATAKELRDTLYQPHTEAEIAKILDSLANYRRWAVPLLKSDEDEAKESGDRNKRLLTSLALLPGDPRQIEYLSKRAIEGDEKQFKTVFPYLQSHNDAVAAVIEAEMQDGIKSESPDMAERKGFESVALLRLGRPERVWPLLRNSVDESVRSHVIHWCAPLGVDPFVILRHWDDEGDSGARSALLLTLGRYSEAGMPQFDPPPDFVNKLTDVVQNDSNPQLHAAAQWLLRKWGSEKELPPSTERLATEQHDRSSDRANGARNWYVNLQGQTFVVIDAWKPFKMGSPDKEGWREPTLEHQHRAHHRQTFCHRCKSGNARAIPAVFDR